MRSNISPEDDAMNLCYKHHQSKYWNRNGLLKFTSTLQTRPRKSRRVAGRGFTKRRAGGFRVRCEGRHARSDLFLLFRPNLGPIRGNRVVDGFDSRHLRGTSDPDPVGTK